MFKLETRVFAFALSKELTSSDWELLVQSFLAMSLARTFILKSAGLKPVEGLVRKSFLFRPLVSRFIAGDTLEESI